MAGEESSNWSRLKAKVEDWVMKEDPSVILLYLPKGNLKDPVQHIKFSGSPRLQHFAKNPIVIQAFINACSTPPSVTTLEEEFPALPDKYLELTVPLKRYLISDFTKIYMNKTKNMLRGYWGNEALKPAFWPEGLCFRGPSSNKATGLPPLKLEELDAVLNSYNEWRSNYEVTEEIHMDFEIGDPSPQGDENSTEYADPSPQGDENSTEDAEPGPAGYENTTEEANPSPQGDENSTEYADPNPQGDENSTEDAEPSLQGDERSTDDDPASILKQALQSAARGSIRLPKETRKGHDRYVVGGQVLMMQDFKSCLQPNWLNDRAIDAYLDLLKGDQNQEEKNHIFALPACFFQLWERGSLRDMCLPKVKFINYTWVFVPVNINDHWVLLAANVPQSTVYVLDSVGSRRHPRLLKMWNYFMHLRAEKEVEELLSWEEGVKVSGRQNDGNACGAFVMLNALALSRGLDPASFSHEDSVAMRNLVLEKLLKSIKKSPSNDCGMPGCKRPQRDNWLRCEICGRWCHFVCANVRSRPTGGFLCVFCTAKYID